MVVGPLQTQLLSIYDTYRICLNVFLDKVGNPVWAGWRERGGGTFAVTEGCVGYLVCLDRVGRPPVASLDLMSSGGSVMRLLYGASPLASFL